MARACGGEFLLRIEDIDQSRARSAWEDAIQEDLHWLGLRWDGPVLRQSDVMPRYHDALDALWARGLLYPCFCRRRDIEEALSAPQETSRPPGPDGPVYPGTCRALPRDPSAPRPRDVALRLDLQAAQAHLPPELCFVEKEKWQETRRIIGTAQTLHETAGDIVVCRRDMGTSYHLSVVLDDAAQGITDVVRGEDLFDATMIHVALQQLLDLPTPNYHHHRLMRDESGKRLAKRDDARALSKYRAEGRTPGDIRAMVGLPRQTSGSRNTVSPPSLTAE